MNCIEAENNVVVLELVDEHGDGVELVVLICVHIGRVNVSLRDVSSSVRGGSAARAWC